MHIYNVLNQREAEIKNLPKVRLDIGEEFIQTPAESQVLLGHTALSGI